MSMIVKHGDEERRPFVTKHEGTWDSSRYVQPWAKLHHLDCNDLSRSIHETPREARLWELSMGTRAWGHARQQEKRKAWEVDEVERKNNMKKARRNNMEWEWEVRQRKNLYERCESLAHHVDTSRGRESWHKTWFAWPLSRGECPAFKTCAYNMAGAEPDYGIKSCGKPVHTAGMVELWARPGKLAVIKVGPT
jgi:hypothetical protein